MIGFMRQRSAAMAALLASATFALTFGGGRAAAAPAGTRWGADYFPNVPLVTQDGQTVHFFDDLLEDKVVVISFIFTSCTKSCPAETAKLRQLQKLLGDRVGKDIFMYSISIDPVRDTPEALKAYARKFDVGPGWLFLTGKEDDVTLLRKKLGLFIAEISDDPEDHNISLIVGNQAMGRWIKRSPFDNSQVLAEVVGGYLHDHKVRDERSEHRRSYAEAKQVPKFSGGQHLFRARCVACHTIGEGDSLGPDLLGVTDRRDRNWLLRWIQVPDEMLAEGDPIAVDLYKKYQELAMPSFQLSETDAEALLEFLETESRRVRSSGAADRQATAHQH